METAQERNSTLVELEALQNDLIARLDDLDQRVCRVLKEWSSTRGGDASTSLMVLPTEGDAAHSVMAGLDDGPGEATPGDPDGLTC